VSDDEGEFFEGSPQLCKAAGSECVGDVLFCCLGSNVDGLLKSTSFWGESNDAGAAVVGIGLAGEVAVVFEVAEQVVDGLLGDLELLGELRWALLVQAGIAEQCDMGRVHIVVSGCDDAREDLLPQPLPGEAHHRADVRAAIQRFA